MHNIPISTSFTALKYINISPLSVIEKGGILIEQKNNGLKTN